MLQRWLIAIGAAGALALAPAVHAQSDGTDPTIDTAAAATSPSLDCNFVGVRILLEDALAMRLVCHVAGAPASDSSFTVAVDSARASCTEGLSAGTGNCIGGVFDPSRQLTVTATLQPSGTTLGPLTVAPTAPAPRQEAPMQFFPLGD